MSLAFRGLWVPSSPGRRRAFFANFAKIFTSFAKKGDKRQAFKWRNCCQSLWTKTAYPGAGFSAVGCNDDQIVEIKNDLIAVGVELSFCFLRTSDSGAENVANLGT